MLSVMPSRSAQAGEQAARVERLAAMTPGERVGFAVRLGDQGLAG
jgi:hypothetical protein